MNLCLKTQEQEHLSEAVRILASPLAFDRPQSWIRQVMISTGKVLGREEKALFDVTPGAGVLAAHHGYNEGDVDEYANFQSLLKSVSMFQRTARLKVATRRMAYGPHYERVMNGPYGMEYLPRIRAYDSLSLTVPLKPNPVRRQDVVQLIIGSTSPGRPFGEKDVGLARLLHPALSSGIATFQRMSAVGDRLGALLDAGGGACAVLDLRGQLLHMTPALDEAISREPRRQELLRRLRGMGTDVAVVLRSQSTTGGMLPVRFTGTAGTFTLKPSLVEGLTSAPCVLVTVNAPTPASAPLPSAGALRAEHGLTQQEARVALLLAERRTNREIADALCISVHTARHHVGRALEKIGATRRQVRALLLN